jgi:hypothetical protein
MVRFWVPRLVRSISWRAAHAGACRHAYGQRFRPAVEQLEDRTVPSSLVVTTGSDATTHTGFSLRDAIAQANTAAAAGTSDTITFDASLAGSTITLAQGQLGLSGAGAGTITIDGSSLTSPITISGGGKTGIFQVSSGVQAVLDGLLIKAGTGAIFSGNLTAGGGIFNQGTLTVSNTVISGNLTNYVGGGIYNAGILSVSNSAVTGNTVGSANGLGRGGGIYNSVTGTLTVSTSNFSFNSAVRSFSFGSGQGGGIYNDGTASLDNTTFYRNSAVGEGGGIYNNATMAISNATLSANTVYGLFGVGGGDPPGGGGIFNFQATLFLHNTIVAGNTNTAVVGDANATAAPTPGIDPDLDGYVSGGNNNLIGDGTGLTGLNAVNGNKIGTSSAPIKPLLGPLANNGGPTQTMALLTGSPAINAGGAVATLANGISANTTNIVVAYDMLAIAATAANVVIRIDNEQMKVTNVLNNNELVVTRGFGTTPAVHNGNAAVFLVTDQRGALRASQDIGAYAFNSPPVVGTPPLDPTCNAGEKVTLTASAFGSPAPRVQWQVSRDGGKTFGNITGATSDVLTFTARPWQNGNEYRAVFTNRFGQAITNAAELVVNFAPAITRQPSSQVVNAGHLVTFTAAAAANPPATVQWQVSPDGGRTFSDIAGATSAMLTFTAQAEMIGDLYRAVFSNALGQATTGAAVLTVDFAPIVTTNPADQVASAGQRVTFTATASANPAATVQWQVSRDGGKTFSDIAGAVSDTLSFIAQRWQSDNQYRAVFRNLLGQAISATAVLTVI